MNHLFTELNAPQIRRDRIARIASTLWHTRYWLLASLIGVALWVGGAV